MSDMPQLPFDPMRVEGYLIELLDKLERIAIVMERFDNVMNPTLGMAAAELEEQVAASETTPFPSVFLQPLQPPAPTPAVQQAG